MATCPSCGKELPGEFPFCPFCTAPLTERPVVAAAEERKVVSVLFCDLVGFTAASEQVDPEDVRARLRPYHERVRLELERHGGTVEKFIGDAVMAVFGAPVSHEDDAERAVRAGLRVLETIDELNAEDARLDLRVRVGVNTGEAVVDREAHPERGEGMVTGDVVNTAARLQALAPVGGVAVGDGTYRLTERLFVFERLEPVVAKGKTEPIECWRPLSAHSRLGADITRTYATQLVGRADERSRLTASFEDAVGRQERRLVTLVGEPGMGKSRLCMELFGYVEERPGLVRWRQGRCLSYGDGIAFWALGEIVKAECGILESDAAEEARAKLERALPQDAQDRAWLLARLGPLVGLPGEPATQEESFTAWRRFLEGLAATTPAVVVFEDLHWADPALLAFLEHLADSAGRAPLLVLCTARPELLETRPDWTAGLRNATTINLAPLTDAETARLVSGLLERAVLPAETQQVLLERAGGNPLYAEEFVRLLTDRGDIAGEIEIPGSVQALIAARLDMLTAECKRLLQDAAVLGKVFWAGALVEMSGLDPAEVERTLNELARKELVRPARGSSMAGEAEYGFWHALVRDVAYGQIPRAGRAERHQQAAVWIERKAGERVEDLADLLAHHYVSALELTEAAGGTEATELRVEAIRYLGLAGERALSLDVDQAERTLSKALELAGEVDPQRPLLLERWARAAHQQNRLHEAREALELALASYRQSGDQLATGRALSQLYMVLGRLGDAERFEVLAEALRLLEAEPPGQNLVEAYAMQTGLHLVSGEFEETITAADKALALAAQLGLRQPANALGFRGFARGYLGEQDGVEEMRQARRLAIEQGEGRTVGLLYNNLTFQAWLYEGPQAALDLNREGIEFCRRRGIGVWAEMMAGGQTPLLAELGQVEQALADAASLADRLEKTGDVAFVEPRTQQLRLLTEQGRHDHAPSPEPMLEAARGIGEPQWVAVAVAAAAPLLNARGNTERARLLLGELDGPAGRGDPIYATLLPGLVRTALALDDPGLAASLTDGVPNLVPFQQHALATSRAQLAEAAGDHREAVPLYADAAGRWHQFGNVPERAYALLGEGRCLSAIGDPTAEQPLVAARELFAAMGYQPALAETEALLRQAQAAAT